VPCSLRVALGYTALDLSADNHATASLSSQNFLLAGCNLKCHDSCYHHHTPTNATGYVRESADVNVWPINRMVRLLVLTSPRSLYKNDYNKVKQSHYTPWRRLGERRYSSYSFLTSTLDGVSGQRQAPAALYVRLENVSMKWRNTNSRKVALALKGLTYTIITKPRLNRFSSFECKTCGSWCLHFTHFVQLSTWHCVRGGGGETCTPLSCALHSGYWSNSNTGRFMLWVTTPGTHWWGGYQDPKPGLTCL
jgi:hypothetical protein